MDNEFVIYPSEKWHNEIRELPIADDETQKRVVELLKNKKMHIVAGLYLNEVKVGSQINWDSDGVHEIIRLERVSKGIVLITHKKYKNEKI